MVRTIDLQWLFSDVAQNHDRSVEKHRENTNKWEGGTHDQIDHPEQLYQPQA